MVFDILLTFLLTNRFTIFIQRIYHELRTKSTEFDIFLKDDEDASKYGGNISFRTNIFVMVRFYQDTIDSGEDRAIERFMNNAKMNKLSYTHRRAIVDEFYRLRYMMLSTMLSYVGISELSFIGGLMSVISVGICVLGIILINVAIILLFPYTPMYITAILSVLLNALLYRDMIRSRIYEGIVSTRTCLKKRIRNRIVNISMFDLPKSKLVGRVSNALVYNLLDDEYQPLSKIYRTTDGCISDQDVFIRFTKKHTKLQHIK